MKNPIHYGSKWKSSSEEMILAYSELIRNNAYDKERYYINFMFNHLPGRTNARIEQMKQEVSRVYAILVQHVIRKPQSARWAHLRPIFIGSPDLPVRKNGRPDRLTDVKINDGLHFNVIALVPCPSPLPLGMNHHPLMDVQSRLRVPLEQHFAQNEHLYLTAKLRRIHLTPITEGTMADYTLKAVKSGRVSPDDILILT